LEKNWERIREGKSVHLTNFGGGVEAKGGIVQKKRGTVDVRPISSREGGLETERDLC